MFQRHPIEIPDKPFEMRRLSREQLILAAAVESEARFAQIKLHSDFLKARKPEIVRTYT